MMQVKESKQGVMAQLVLRGLVAPIMMAVLLMISAGRMDYWQGWVYMGLNMGLLLVNLWTVRRNPELVEERLKPGEGMKGWDKLYFALTTTLYFAHLIVAGLDVGRFGWTGDVPWSVYVGAIAIYLIGQAIFMWAKWVNRYFSSVVRIQADRGQTVCRDGPYRYVRHPGYVGGLLYMLAGSLVLGSLWAFALQALACMLLVVRTALEDRALQAELPGYAEYVLKTRYRLLPGIW